MSDSQPTNAMSQFIQLPALLRLLRRGRIGAGYRWYVTKRLLFSLLLEPFRLYEKLYWGRRIAATELTAPPVFLLGMGRSGTTHLYNILSKSAGFASVFPLEAGLPGDILFLGRFVRPFLAKALPETRLIDRVEVNIRLL